MIKLFEYLEAKEITPNSLYILWSVANKRKTQHVGINVHTELRVLINADLLTAKYELTTTGIDIINSIPGGGGTTTIGTGILTDASYGINYTASHLRLSAGEGTRNVEIFGNVVPTASNTYTLGNTTAWWSKSFTVAATAQYADLAENYTADAEYAPGTVVHFGGEQEVSICDIDMCTRVAGVVSTNPAYLMNGRLESTHVVAVALTGRVPTKVRGPISKGDLIVSAGEGYARAETLPQVGTVIGKALEDFEGDTGVIEVVVGKH